MFESIVSKIIISLIKNIIVYAQYDFISDIRATDLL